jgi:hypothetical protein
VVAADQAALIRLLEGLPAREVPDPFAPIGLEVHRVTERGFVIFGWRAGARRAEAAQEMEDLADELSQKLGRAVAVHYDDQVGLRAAVFSQDGEPLLYFGEEDEVWVPYSEGGELLTNGPRYPGNAIPEDIECDCIWNGVDAALEAAGFRNWITSRRLAAEVAHKDRSLWQRPGVQK